MGLFRISRFLPHAGSRKDSTGLKKIARAGGQRKGPHWPTGRDARRRACEAASTLAFLSGRPSLGVNLGQARRYRLPPSVRPPLPLDCAAMDSLHIALRLVASALVAIALGLI